MEEDRIAACHRIQNKHRKYLIVVNDVVKNKYGVYSEYISKTHAATVHKLEMSETFVKRALVRQKILKKCMQMRRANVDIRDGYGRYGGKTLEAFGKDIEHFMAYNHPKVRRQRYLNQLKIESLEKGAILKEKVAADRVARWMERSYTKFKLKHAKKEKTILAPISENEASSTESKYKSSRRIEDESSVLKLSDDIKKMAVTDRDHTDDDSKARSRPRPTLVLPPIKQTRAMVAT